MYIHKYNIYRNEEHMSEQIFNVVEHFASINGEGVRAGELAVTVIPDGQMMLMLRRLR